MFLFENFLKQNALLLSLIAVVVIIIVATILIILSVTAAKRKEKPVIKVNQNALFTHLGGENNIISLEKNGSRLTVALHDFTLINELELKKLGVVKFIKMTTKLILLVDDSFNEIKK